MVDARGRGPRYSVIGKYADYIGVHMHSCRGTYSTFLSQESTKRPGKIIILHILSHELPGVKVMSI